MNFSIRKRSIPDFGIYAILAVIVLIALRGDYAELPWIRINFLEGGGGDFWGYYVAAVVVRNHRSASLYQEAEWKDIDPVEDYADPSSDFAQTAKSCGISPVPMYDYPPTLADLLLPLTWARPRTALYIWEVLNLAAILASGVLLSRLLGYKSVTAYATVFFSLMLFRPTLNTIHMAQVSVLLLLLLLCAVHLCARNRTLASGFSFSLAAAIKLTPLIVVVPLIAWRDWKVLRAVLFSGIVLFFLLFALNGWPALDLYFLHELPTMAHSRTDPENRGLTNAVQVLLQGTAMTAIIPLYAWIGKALSMIALCVAAWLCKDVCQSSTFHAGTARALFAFFLLAACLSPVSWLHAFVLGAPTLAFAFQRMLEHRSNFIEITLVSLLVLCLSTYTFLRLEMLTPFLGIAICFIELRHLRSARIAA